jgi:fructokinase
MILNIGEAVFDVFIDNYTKEYKQSFGGGTLNVASALNKLHVDNIFIGCVGCDTAGNEFTKLIRNENINYIHVKQVFDRNTPLVLILIDENQNVTYSSFCKRTADKVLAFHDVVPFLSDSQIITLGSLMLSEGSGRLFADSIIEYSKVNNIIVAFDVNYRDNVFNDKQEAKEILLKYARNADIVKLSKSEAEFISNELALNDIIRNLNKIFKRYYVTLDSEGVIVSYDNNVKKVDTISVVCNDPTGAGDAFFAGVLSHIVKDTKGIYDINALCIAALYGNIAGAITVREVGTNNAFPTFDELHEEFKNLDFSKMCYDYIFD